MKKMIRMDEMKRMIRILMIAILHAIMQYGSKCRQ